MMIYCEGCCAYYEIPSRVWRTRLVAKILFFTQCPSCGALRNEASKHYPYPRCTVCNCPGHLRNGKCAADYMIWYRAQRKKVTISEPNSILQGNG